MIVFPNCKINLGLHILRKRADGFHDLETVFFPLPLKDGLEIVRNTSGNEDAVLTTSGLPVNGGIENNICSKAYRLLKKDFPDLPPVQMHLHKTIPIGAGLGGGSADGAFTIVLLNKKFDLKLSQEQMLQYALQLGSDCAFFIKNKPCFATGRGEILHEIDIDLSPYKLIVVNPQIPINTAWAFSMIKPSERPSLLNSVMQDIPTWKDSLTNDFEKIVFDAHPEIQMIKQKLYQIGAVYASMSGSGSTVYGLFNRLANPVMDFPSHYFIKQM